MTALEEFVARGRAAQAAVDRLVKPRERQILFSAPMVRAILNGRKTQTRRLVRDRALEWLQPGMFAPEYVALRENSLSPYGFAGDRLWVRETWRPTQDPEAAYYLADEEWNEGAGWKPSIFMPRKFSRIKLELTDVRIQRLQEITEEDARAEGFSPEPRPGRVNGKPAMIATFEPRLWFAQGWDGLNWKRAPWSSNPWVWVLTFRRVEG